MAGAMMAPMDSNSTVLNSTAMKEIVIVAKHMDAPTQKVIDVVGMVMILRIGKLASTTGFYYLGPMSYDYMFSHA
jgi:hypothetical protein